MVNLETHKAVLKKWQSRPPHDTHTFVSDGPIDPNRWLKAERRVLFLLKEAYWEDRREKTWDLPTLIREDWKGPRKKMWWSLGYWAYGIQRLTSGQIPSNPQAGQLWNEVKESVLASAVVNIKKSGGRSSSSDDDLRRYVDADGDLLEQQVACLSPHVVVCCKTWGLVKNILWPSAEKISERVYNIDGMLVLDFWHPANRYPDVMNYYTVVALLHRAPFPGRPSTHGDAEICATSTSLQTQTAAI